MVSFPIQYEQGFSDYTRVVNKYPILKKEEEYILAKRVTDCHDIEAARSLITSHLRLVVKIAIRMRNYKVALMDLISEGNLGLIHAVKKFKPDLGYRFSTYAMWWIKASIQEFIIKSWSLVKIGTTVAHKKLFFQLNKVKDKLQRLENNNQVSDQDIADQLDVSKREVMKMDERLNYADISLDTPINEYSTETLLERISNEDVTQEKILEDAQEFNYRRKLFQRAMGKLNERERDIISSRHLQEKADTLKILSKKYNVSRERIRQIEEAAMKKLRNDCLAA